MGEARVVAVSSNGEYSFSKPNRDAITLVAGLGVEGDVHSGVTVKHRSRVARDPSQPNLRQVHLMHSELHDELRGKGYAIEAGQLGENITTAGLDVSGALMGETWRLGTAVVQIASVRVPCATFAGWMGERHWVKRFAAAGRPGAYLRVLEEGAAGPGDPVEVLSRPPDGVTVAGAMRAHYGDADLMRRLLGAPGLDPKWEDVAVSVLGRPLPQGPVPQGPVPQEPAAG